MTYIPVDVFIECFQTSGIKSKYEYYELHDRGIVPTDLMPKYPVLEYGDTYQQSPKIRARKKAYRESPENREKAKAHQQTPEWKAYQKAFYQRPEQIARRKAYRERPDVRARKKANQKAWYLREKLSKKLASKHTK